MAIGGIEIPKSPHALSHAQIFDKLQSKAEGLTEKEVGERRAYFGRNEIKQAPPQSYIYILLNQFSNILVIILIFAAVVSGFLGEWADTAVIIFLVLINASLGFFQELKAEKAIESLKKMAASKAVVIRDRHQQKIESGEVVPGDILFLQEGDKIAADARLFEAANISTHEAVLTGESNPVLKSTIILPEVISIADQKNMVFGGTVVASGIGKAVVIKTGLNTQIGNIAHLVGSIVQGQTPLQKKLEKFGNWLGRATLFVCFIIFLLTFFKNNDIKTSFLIAVSLAVAAIPEGLPVTITISLALATRRMLSQNVLVRRLPAVEGLGSVNVICTDKTGTLTRNELTVRKIYFSRQEYTLTGSGYSNKGEFLDSWGKRIDPKQLDIILKIGVLCNNSDLRINSASNEASVNEAVGDPTEVALLVSALKAGISNEKIQMEYEKITEIPFDSERKMMSSLYKNNSGYLMYSKGAVESVLAKCSKIYIDGKIKNLSSEQRAQTLQQNDILASQALRVLAFAYRPLDSEKDNDEKELIFVGLQAMYDAPRENVKESIAQCREAGIRVIMITGDHKLTALAVAKEICMEGDSITGQELDSIKDKNWADILKKYSIFARITHNHKLQIVEALQKLGNSVAVTGDGANDAPALKKADIGVAMGITGTEVAKEASQMVLLDDAFTSIVKAIGEGRLVYDNILRFINYLLSANLGEILVVLISVLIGFPLPLTAIQLLWINIVTDGLPAVAVSLDPPEKNIMKRKPRPRNDPIPSHGMKLAIIAMALAESIFVIILFIWKISEGNLVKAQSVVFTALVVFELMRLLLIRSHYGLKMFSNKWLIIAICISLLLQLTVIYSPVNSYFDAVALSVHELAIIFFGGILMLFSASLFLRLLMPLRERSLEVG